MRKHSVRACRDSGSVNSFKARTVCSDDIERFRDADRNWEPRFVFPYNPFVLGNSSANIEKNQILRYNDVSFFMRKEADCEKV